MSDHSNARWTGKTLDNSLIYHDTRQTCIFALVDSIMNIFYAGNRTVGNTMIHWNTEHLIIFKNATQSNLSSNIHEYSRTSSPDLKVICYHLLLKNKRPRASKSNISELQTHLNFISISHKF